MTLTMYQVDAFAEEIFSGNPAAIIPLTEWLDDETMQAIAAENNLSETAYFVPEGEGFALRWFTPGVEVDLCGHATLAAAHVLFEHLAYASETIVFSTRSGPLRVTRSAEGITLDFPATDIVPVEVDIDVCNALGATASEALTTPDGNGMQLYVYEFEEDVAALAPDFSALLNTGKGRVIATAPGNEVDFVSRFFGPAVGVNEDPVTGSAHCTLVPYWAGRLGKEQLQARQISQRVGNLACELRDGRVFMTGRAVSYLQGMITL